MLNQKFLEEQKRRLQEEEKNLKERLSQFTKKSGHDKEYQSEFPDFGQKDDENAAEVAIFQDRLSLEQDLEAALGRAKQALKKIENNQYGICERCNQEISQARLKAFPEAAFCINCKK